MAETDRKFYVVSLKTLKHEDVSYIALGSGRPGPTNWYITNDRDQAYAFATPYSAREMADELNAKTDEVTLGLVAPEKRDWHVANMI